ncbi:phosphoenolpyruvate--protein phosphotransferase [Jatrophihabitans sp.]|uniref:phosphoenolpyruvate--protein phosphotransferase n=1 Tax=Jatrophihabitans sp. TaxID=1932789 RepID=UPI002B53B2EA|nr:phosphoenolpyruvate--protein phosphotransferase [Jatrophihabitans sp.]
MVGIVVVSHSRALARAAVELAEQMLHGHRPSIAIAAGLDETTLGTDAVQVKEAIERVDSPDGVVVLLDLGSALLSAELALDLLDEATRARVVLSPAPLVEGLVAAVVTAAGGGTTADVAAEASGALAGKVAHLAATSGAVIATESMTDGDAVRGVFTVGNPHGLHARPAARLVAQVRTHDARVHLTNLTTGDGPVPASSLSRVATLGARQGHQVEVSVTGSQAAEALEHILALAGRHFDEQDAPEPPRRPTETAGPVVASPGIAIAPARRAGARAVVIPDDEPGDATTRWRRLREALAATRRDLARTRARISRETSESDAAIFDAHLMLLDDAELLNEARHLIDSGFGPARAWQDAVTGVEHEFSQLDDSYLRGRAADVRAVGDQVLRHLLGIDTGLGARAGILVAADLTPAEAAELDAGLVQAVVLAYGSATSHAAILATAKGIPMLVAAGTHVLEIADGTPLVVDGDTGELLIDPADEVVREYRARLANRNRAEAVAHAAAMRPAVTVDGVTIAINANIGSVDDAKAAADAHADGAGLVRTEFLFQSRAEPPTLGEQDATYRAITDAFAGRRVVFRTLDAGGDKPLPFAPVAAEANPFLGIRGLRLSLHHPDLLLEQLRAICAVAADAPVSVMFPMVSTLDELLAATALLDEACSGHRPDSLRVGIMVEVPAVALKAAAFAPHVDFFSVGTNDLTQYALAAERGNPALATLADPLDPGVLRLIAELCRQAGDASVSVCGEIATDPVAAQLLLGLGVDSLSVAAPAVARIKQVVRTIDTMRAAKVAAKALTCASASEVRRIASE